MTTKINDPFKNAQKQMLLAHSLMKDKENHNNKIDIISNPKRIIEISIPVKMDNWTVKIFTWYRSQHNDARWPFKWWIRFHQDVNVSEVKALSMWMSIKCSVIDLPLWGWKWWIIVNPKELSEWELERLSRWYVKELYKYIGPEQDVPAPDVNTTPQIMAWMMDEYSKLVWVYSPGSFTGKPLTCGGSKWRWEATAQWWVYVLQKILELKWDTLKWKKIIIQWAWNAWLTMAKLLTELWAKLIWISDSAWWIYNEKWLSINEIIQIKESNKSVIEYVNWEIINNGDIIEKNCDILIPAALENQITISNVESIKAKLILELANGPITPQADEVLTTKKIEVIPDILANSGWVMVSYFEQVQNNSNYYWEEEEVNTKLKTKIESATKDVFNISKEYNTTYRTAAYIISMKRIFSAMSDRWNI